MHWTFRILVKEGQASIPKLKISTSDIDFNYQSRFWAKNWDLKVAKLNHCARVYHDSLWRGTRLTSSPNLAEEFSQLVQIDSNFPANLHAKECTLNLQGKDHNSLSQMEARSLHPWTLGNSVLAPPLDVYTCCSLMLSFKAGIFRLTAAWLPYWDTKYAENMFSTETCISRVFDFFLNPAEAVFPPHTRASFDTSLHCLLSECSMKTWWNVTSNQTSLSCTTCNDFFVNWAKKLEAEHMLEKQP